MNEILRGIEVAALGAVTRDEAGGVARRYLFEERFAGFAGHFPNYPILPAIVEILTVVSLVGEESGSRQRLVAVADAKFLSPIRPNQEVLVECRQKSARGKLLHEAQLSVAGKTAASFLLELAGQGESR